MKKKIIRFSSEENHIHEVVENKLDRGYSGGGKAQGTSLLVVVIYTSARW